jgi:hypothetical protein
VNNAIATMTPVKKQMKNTSSRRVRMIIIIGQGDQGRGGGRLA